MAADPTINLVHNLDQFADRLAKMGGYMGAMAGSVAKWGGKDAIFSALMAKKTRDVIRMTIYYQGPGPGGEGANVNWKDLNTVYETWKESVWGNKGIWRLGGNVLKNVVARKTSTGYDVGLNRKVRVPRLQYGRQGSFGSKGDKISLEEYASYMEYGTNRMDPRPLFTPSILKVVQEDYPKLLQIVENDIKRCAKLFASEELPAVKYHSASLSEVVGSSVGNDLVSGISANEAYINEVLSGIKSGQGGCHIAPGGRNIDLSAKSQTGYELKKELKSDFFENTTQVGSADEKAEMKKWIAENPALAKDLGYM